MAFLMSNVALSIDTVLPALPNIGLSLQVANSNDLQLIIIMIFLGLGLGELVFGTLSDSFGRKPVVYIGVGIFVLASFLIIWSPTLKILLLGRVIQGIGLSAARSVSISIIRDTYQGDRMARIMSFIMTIFILVPMLAPLLGQLILLAYDWKAIFYFQLFFISITIIWFWARQEETLTAEKRIPISRHLFTDGLKEYFKFSNSVLFTIMTGVLQGTFIAYLGAAQQIFQDQYQMINEFPYIFGGLALALGLSTLLNSSLVLRYGMLKMVNFSLYIAMLSSLAYILCFLNASNPTLSLLIAFLVVQFLALGSIPGNLSALAMQPIGHIAGIGAAIFSFISMTIGVIVAILIGHFIQDTAIPLFAGFCLSGIFALMLIRFIKPNI